MKIQLWRNATVKLSINDTNFLIDPMLGEKGSFGEFPWIEDGIKNPIVDLPFSNEELKKELEDIDAVLISHLHPDHWDEKAIQLLEKSIPLICPAEIKPAIESYGFQNVEEIKETISFRDVQIHLTEGLHGRGEIGEKMGKVNGFVFEYRNEKIYFAGDTIWCDDVRHAINKYSPQHIVVAGGAATFAFGNPVTMTTGDIKSLASYSEDFKIWITHLEAISPCKESRPFVKEGIRKAGLENRCFVLKDGEKADLTER